MFFEGAISADSHVLEPPACFDKFMSPQFRERAPRIELDEWNRHVYVIDGLTTRIPIGTIDCAGMPPSMRTTHILNATFETCRRSAWDPQARLADQERDGIAAEVIYPTVGLIVMSHADIDYKDACIDAYNRWLEGFCAGLPERLFGLAMTSMRSIDAAIDDFTRAKERGFVGMMLPASPQFESYDHPDWDALWQCAVDLQMPVCFHILTGKGHRSAESILKKQVRGKRMSRFMQIVRDVQDVIVEMLLGGVFERHPNLKMVSAEADAGWVPHWAYRLDHAAYNETNDGIVDGLSKLPSEYLFSNVFTTFQDDWVAFATKDLMNYKQLLWANDFPHPDSTWPRSQKLLAEHAVGLTPAERNAILRDNVRELFQLPIATV
ncbi:MAG: amidohydrolase family protein [Acidiferrobacterales bacterium]|nr:amidohydrolase family protein [Acidiferrobacterales bacterium]